MQDQSSFSFFIKNELAHNMVEKDEARSILGGFLKINGSLDIIDQNTNIIFKTENNETGKFLYQLLKKYYPETSLKISFVKSMKLYKSIEYHLRIVDGAAEFLDDICFGLLDSKIPSKLKSNEEEIRGYLIGSFLASGSCNNPQSSNYHLEMSVNDEKYAQELLRLIKKIKNTVFNFKCVQRRNKYVIYLKRSDQISDFLAFLNASNSCLEFENIRIDRDFLNSTNRLMNCDANNFNKTLEISQKQIEMIKFIDQMVGIDHISNEKLSLLCMIRLNMPEANYNELAEALSEKIGKSVSKSNINHLFIRLKAFYKELGGDGKD